MLASVCTAAKIQETRGLISGRLWTRLGVKNWLRLLSQAYVLDVNDYSHSSCTALIRPARRGPPSSGSELEVPGLLSLQFGVSPRFREQVLPQQYNKSGRDSPRVEHA